MGAVHDPRLPIRSPELRKLHASCAREANVFSSLSTSSNEYARLKRLCERAEEIDRESSERGWSVTAAWISQDGTDVFYATSARSQNAIAEAFRVERDVHGMTGPEYVREILLWSGFDLGAVHLAGRRAQIDGVEAERELGVWVLLNGAIPHIVSAFQYIRDPSTLHSLVRHVSENGSPRDSAQIIFTVASEPLLSEELEQELVSGVLQCSDVELVKCWEHLHFESSRGRVFAELVERKEAFAINLLLGKVSSEMLSDVVGTLIELGNLEYIARALRRPLPEALIEKIVLALESHQAGSAARIAARFELPEKFRRRVAVLAGSL